MLVAGLFEIDSVLAVHNRHDGLINTLLALNDNGDVKVEFRGLKSNQRNTALKHFLGDLFEELSVIVTLKSGKGGSRRVEAVGKRGLDFLGSYGRDDVEAEERRANVESYTGTEKLGLKTTVHSDNSTLSVENTLFVWPHLYDLPFDIIVGESVMTLKSAMNETSSVVVKAFNLTRGVGAAIDAVVNVTDADALKSAVSWLWKDNVVNEPVFDISGVYKPVLGSVATNVSLSFLRPKFSEGVSNFVSVLKNGGRR